MHSVARRSVEASSQEASREAVLRLSNLDHPQLRPLHVFIVFACAFALAFDLAELVIASALSALFSAPPAPVDPRLLSWLLSAVYVGAFVGAVTAGWLADRYGRRATLLAALAILAVTSSLAAASPNMACLIVSRGLSGIALGAYPPLAAAYLTDVLPASRRGPLIMATVSIGSLGAPAMIFLVRWLTPLQPLGIESWRWAFAVGALGAAACAMLFLFVPESPRWLASKGRFAEARRVLTAFAPAQAELEIELADKPVRPEETSPDERGFARRLGLVLVVFFLAPWSVVGFPILSGAVLINKGIDLRDSLLYVGVSYLGPIIGTLLAGLFIDKFERKTALTLCAAAMMVLGIVFSATTLPLWLMGTGLFYNMAGTMFQTILVIYAAEIFTTSMRGRATSWAWAARGAASAIAPLVLLPLLHSSGANVMFALIGVTLAMAIMVLGFFGPRGEAGRSIR